jgi:hypothetical protein
MKQKARKLGVDLLLVDTGVSAQLHSVLHLVLIIQSTFAFITQKFC